MGMIKIQLLGSFDPQASQQFSAQYGGHALAVAQAIEWLSKEALPAAIRRDHLLHADGELPIRGFGVQEPS